MSLSDSGPHGAGDCCRPEATLNLAAQQHARAVRQPGSSLRQRERERDQVLARIARWPVTCSVLVLLLACLAGWLSTQFFFLTHETSKLEHRPLCLCMCVCVTIGTMHRTVSRTRFCRLLTRGWVKAHPVVHRSFTRVLL